MHERLITDYPGPWGAEPRRKSCRLGVSGCNECANCQRDAWSLIWQTLHDEDKQWVISHYELVGLKEWHALPSLSRYVLM